MIDFHLHTNASDGVYTLEEVVSRAEAASLSAIAITDHDTIKSARRINELKPKIEVVPGIEISVYDNKRDYIDLHVLGFFLDTKSPKLQSTLERLKRDRESQKKAIISRLNELGYDITYEEAKAKAGGSVGRPHIAKVLIDKYPDEFKVVPDVFGKLLDQGKPAFQGRTAFFCLDDAINMVHDAGGLAFLAHPEFYRYKLGKLLEDFKGLGGDGIESVYDYARNYAWKGYSEKDNERIKGKLRGLAKEMDFLETGGSDMHGPNKGAPLGTLEVPDEFLERMRASLNPDQR
ncbi:MAG: PHP domain-containing protein [Candidatus Micrarchaeota archaeon]